MCKATPDVIFVFGLRTHFGFGMIHDLMMIPRITPRKMNSDHRRASYGLSEKMTSEKRESNAKTE